MQIGRIVVVSFACRDQTDEIVHSFAAQHPRLTLLAERVLCGSAAASIFSSPRAHRVRTRCWPSRSVASARTRYDSAKVWFSPEVDRFQYGDFKWEGAFPLANANSKHALVSTNPRREHEHLALSTHLLAAIGNAPTAA